MSYLDTHTAILGSTGAGKTVTAKKAVESLLDQQRHVAIIDPTGAWHGLRSNAAGDGPGYPIPIFGGAHGDVQILPEQGEVIGEIIAGGASGVVDLSGMESRDQRRFALNFMRALRKKPRTFFHLIVDEADEFAPQTAPDDIGFELTEQMKWVAKRGRLSGFVMMAITQRPADISKAVLSQVQTVIAHQLIAPQDQKAIDDFLRANGDPQTRKAVMASLAGLQRGERWVYSPRLGLLERGITEMPVTFDSSRTPEPGALPQTPKMLAEIDLSAIRAALKPVIDKATIELPPRHNSDEILKLRAELSDVRGQLAKSNADRDHWKHHAEARMVLIDRARAALQADGSEVAPAPTSVKAAAQSLCLENAPKPARQPAPPREGPFELNAAARKMLEMLERIAPAKVPWGSLAAMIGNKARGGNFNAARKAMRDSGLIVEEGDYVRSAILAAEGMTRAEAFELWTSVLSNPAPKMMLELRKCDGMTKQQLGDALGIVPRGGNFNNGVAQLIRNGVAVDRGGMLHLTSPLPGESA